jgi:epoxyqueuosine reductase
MSSSTELTTFIKQEAIAHGFDIVGIAQASSFEETEARLLDHIEQGHIAGLAWFTPDRASFSCSPANLLPEVRSIISLGISYLNSEPIIPTDQFENQSKNQPKAKIARYAWGKDYHEVLKEKMTALYESLRKYKGLEAGEARFLVDTARIVDRAVAQRAGVGFFGKNTNIINKKYGSWIFLCEILTNLELDYDTSGLGTCGKCTRCIDACPTAAIVQPGVVHNDHCIAYLTIELKDTIPTELRPQMGNWIFGCDICQEVCPYNKKALAGNHPELQPVMPDDAHPSLIEWLKLTADEQAFRQKFRGTPILRTKRAGLRRNIAVALGNSGFEAAIEPLQAALQDEANPVVQEHLSWALQKIQTKPNS